MTVSSADLMLELQSADILMMNNEFTYSDRGDAVPGKAYTFRATPSRVQKSCSSLERMCDRLQIIMSMITEKKHCFDTLDTLEKAGYPYVGAGENLKEAEKIVYFICKWQKNCNCIRNTD